MLAIDVDEWFRWIVGILLATLTLIFGGIIKHIVTKLDAKANRDSTDARFTDALERMDEHIKEDRETHDKILNRLVVISDRIGETNVLVARLMGRHEEREK